MLEVAGEEISTLSMDHHGLVAAVCKNLKIAERIDTRIKSAPDRIVSVGQAVVAMILNGLGFTNRRLYLTHQFFETKLGSVDISPAAYVPRLVRGIQ